MSTTKLLAELLSQWGIEKVHIAASCVRDWEPLEQYPENVASLTVIFPSDPGESESPLARVTHRLLGDSRRNQRFLSRAKAENTECHVTYSKGYIAHPWSDVFNDQGDVIQAMLLEQRKKHPCVKVSLHAGSGHIEDLHYQISGEGQPLVLFPQLISPAQWDVLLPVLNQYFTVIILSGCDIGFVGHLEDRARDAGWDMLQRLLVKADIQSKQRILDLGCGGGALLKRTCSLLPDDSRIVGLDHNPFLLRESGRSCGENSSVDPVLATAEELPFMDSTIDLCLSFTLFEEINAQTALSEIRRVLKPGGKVLLVVRALDMPWIFHLGLPETSNLLYEKEAVTVGSGVSDKGCADRSLYELMSRTGFKGISALPQHAISHPGRRFDYLFRRLLLLDRKGELKQRYDAGFNDYHFIGEPFHCVMGVK